ncbi:hypothetical protein CPB83DRAFT_926844, partial [Crepidotus variabilis]
LLTEKELDARVKALPPSFGVRHFSNGFSVLSQISGPERKEMTKILLGCLVGEVSEGILIAIRALLDFIYLAQYKAHDDETLGYMENALQRFHTHKKYLIEAKLHKDLAIPKFHSLLHYIHAIKEFGTTDNYNTELFERFHIDYAKEGYRASNKRDIFPQMVAWLSRREKISMFDNYLDFKDNLASQQSPTTATSNSLEPSIPSQISIAKHPSFPHRPITTIQKNHASPLFSDHLKDFLNAFLSHPTSNAQSHSFDLPFNHLDIWSQFKFDKHALQSDDIEAETDTVKAIPRSKDDPSGRFDTVVALWDPTAEETGTTGKLRFLDFKAVLI